MFKIVQKYGGFNEVSRKNRWLKVAEDLSFAKIKKPHKKLDSIYLKYVLPYDVLNNNDRNKINTKLEQWWLKKHNRMLKRCQNPLHGRKVILGESDTSESEDEVPACEKGFKMSKSAFGIEDCVKRGRKMTLATFRKVDANAVEMFFPNEPTAEEVEKFYWKTVLLASDHICIHSASIDTSSSGIGFTTDPNDPLSKHPWNLKNILNNDANILRSMGEVVSITVPVLHLGMLFSTNCWHRDPHGLPWMEYLHEGKEKIWYGIPDEQSDRFRRAVEQLCPTSVQNKSIWLPSDITMIPPKLLLNEGVTLTRTTQKAGEYIFIFPKAYSSSICTRFSISESVYFAVQPWPITIQQVFQELRESCEPMMFAPEQLLIAMSRDERVSLTLLQQVFPNLINILEEELDSRYKLVEAGLVEQYVERKGAKQTAWSACEANECDVCRRPLYLSKVKGKIGNKKILKACPQDAYQLLPRHKEADLTLEIFVVDAELRFIMKSVQHKLLNL